MKKLFLVFLSLLCLIPVCGCAKKAEKLPVKVLIVPHFEIGEMENDETGEAQLFFEEYFEHADVYSVADGISLWYHPENQAAMFLTGVGKVNAATSVTAVLGDDRFDFSDTALLAVGCSGGAVGYAVLGDVILESAVCDYDLGHTADSSETIGDDLWFPSPEYDEIGCRKLDPDTVARAYELTKDVKLDSTEVCRRMLARNFPGEEWAARDPAVIKGTSVTSDNYWKGQIHHGKAMKVAEYYQCPDPYASTEMEDAAVLAAAERFGLLDRTLILRAVVNVDVFTDGAAPESLWGQKFDFIDAISESNEETLDIFSPAMENLFRVGKTVIDAILSGEF